MVLFHWMGNQETQGLVYLLWLGGELGIPDLGCLLGGRSRDAGSAGATRCGMWDDSTCPGFSFVDVVGR